MEVAVNLIECARVVGMRQPVSCFVTLVVGVIGLLTTAQLPLLSQVVTYCPGRKFYQTPASSTPVMPELPSGGLGMVSASGVSHGLQRDPHRVNGWVEVFVVSGRGGDPKGPYWMKERDFRCGKFVGR